MLHFYSCEFEQESTLAYQIFEKKATRMGTPAVTVLKNGRMALNSAATQVLHKNAVEFVLLLWDEDNLRLALRPISKRDSRAYKITYGLNNSGSSFSAKSFMDHIGWNLSANHTVAMAWNESEGMLEASVPPNFLKDSRQQKLLPVELGKKHAR